MSDQLDCIKSCQCMHTRLKLEALCTCTEEPRQVNALGSA